MDWLCVTIRPASAFGSPVRGDTLFGQLCWAIRDRHGEARLAALLTGYTAGDPFLVASDGFPSGYLPRPELPPPAAIPPGERKSWKRRRWLPVGSIAKPVGGAHDDAAELRLFCEAPHPHNSVRRDTGTTGRDGFAPYQLERLWPVDGLRLDLHLAHDPARLSLEDLMQALEDVGSSGYGRDASSGLGQFRIESRQPGRPPSPPSPNAWLALAPCAPQSGAWAPERCYWRPFTRFGRHGSYGAVIQPFKMPVLLADTGAVLAPASGELAALFAGSGIGGDGALSSAIPQTVHQGYAPVLPIQVELPA